MLRIVQINVYMYAHTNVTNVCVSVGVFKSLWRERELKDKFNARTLEIHRNFHKVYFP